MASHTAARRRGAGPCSHSGPSAADHVDQTAASLSAELTSSPTASASKTSRSRTSSERSKYRSMAPEPVSAGCSGRATTARYGVAPRSRSVNTGQRRRRSSSTANTGCRVSCAVMQGPAPTVNCRRSAVSAASELAPSGTRCWAASSRLRPAPSTCSIRAHARASRTGSSSGPSRPGSCTSSSAASNRAAMLTPDCPAAARGSPVGTARCDHGRRGAAGCCPTATGRCSSRLPTSRPSPPSGLRSSGRRCPASASWCRPHGPCSSSSTGRRPTSTSLPCAGFPRKRRGATPRSARWSCRWSSTDRTSPTWPSWSGGRCRTSWPR